MDLKTKQKKLKEIARQVARCNSCSLFKEATNPVPGEGPAGAKIMFIGEAPGFYEDQRGIPFCGPAGRLLEKLLASIGLERSEVFIGNMVKHRPPNNRDPRPEEIKACQPFLDKQIKIVDPEVIVTLGRFSLNKFLPGEYISSIHGRARFVRVEGKKRIVIPMYHPAAALRREKIMEEIKRDFLKIRQILAGEQALIEEGKEESVQLSFL